MAAFIFWSPRIPGLDPHDSAQHRRIVADVYQQDDGVVADLVAAFQDAPRPWFDAVSEVRIDRWSDRRVALLGDAASCVSLFGAARAWRWPAPTRSRGALSELPGDLAAALRRYEARHRRRVIPRQRSVGLGAHLLVPTTRAGLAARNLLLRALPQTFGGVWASSRRTGPRPDVHSRTA
ncbi:MAG: hypothetical protein R3F59_12105 [Myxococcota bacterium]